MTSVQTAMAPSVSRMDLFLGFLKIGLLGFGGVAPWARYIIVEERHWLTEADYAGLLGVGQILPGANTVNASVMIGDRFQGLAGSILCVLGLMIAPLAILIAVATAYASFAESPVVAAAVGGAAAAASGIVIGTGVKMLRSLSLSTRAMAVCAAAFFAIGVFGLPLVPVLAVLIPASVLGAWLEQRH